MGQIYIFRAFFSLLCLYDFFQTEMFAAYNLISFLKILSVKREREKKNISNKNVSVYTEGLHFKPTFRSFNLWTQWHICCKIWDQFRHPFLRYEVALGRVLFFITHSHTHTNVHARNLHHIRRDTHQRQRGLPPTMPSVCAIWFSTSASCLIKF